VAGPGETFYGTVFIRNFDMGLIKDTLGATLFDVVRDGETTKQFILDLPELDGYGSDEYSGKIPVIFWPPEGVFDPYIVPAVVVRPGDPIPALQRWESLGGKAYRLPAEGAKLITLSDGRQGYDRYEDRPKGMPFDIPYDVEFKARKRWQKVVMLKHAMKKFWPRVFYTTDTAGNERTYGMNVEAQSSADELADVADRTLVYVMSLLVEAELDINDPVIHRAVTQNPVFNFENADPDGACRKSVYPAGPGIWSRGCCRR